MHVGALPCSLDLLKRSRRFRISFLHSVEYRYRAIIVVDVDPFGYFIDRSLNFVEFDSTVRFFEVSWFTNRNRFENGKFKDEKKGGGREEGTTLVSTSL